MGLPWRASWLDVRIVERARRCLPGSRSTASPNSPRVHGGVEVVATSRLTRQRRRWLVIAVAVSAALANGACSGGDDDGASPTTTSAPRSTTSTERVTTTTVTDDTAAVTAAYEAASRAFIDAAAIPDPNFPAIGQTHIGPMLEQTTNLLRALQLDGRFIRYPANSSYRIAVEDVEVTDEVARLTACVVDDGERVERATGNVVAGGTVTVQWTAAMRRVEGTWRLAERREEARWDGVAGCAV